MLPVLNRWFVQQPLQWRDKQLFLLRFLSYLIQANNEYSGSYNIVDIEAEQDLLSGPRQELGISKLADRVLLKIMGMRL